MAQYEQRLDRLEEALGLNQLIVVYVWEDADPQPAIAAALRASGLKPGDADRVTVIRCGWEKD